MEIIILFATLQIINVILNTAKTLIMSRTDNPHMSALINAITFGFYVAVVKQIATLDLTTTIIITVITNVIGVYITYAIARKLRKDDLWKVEIFAPNQSDMLSICDLLDEGNVSYYPDDHLITAYCYTQTESKTVNDALKLTAEHGVKYNITVITKKFH